MSISSIPGSSNRISGIVSGLDTEELVKNLTSATQSKIDKAEQQKQILEWKQDDYREILSELVDFNEKYFGTSSSSISLGNTLNKLTATSSNSSYVSVVSGDEAKSGSVYINDIVSLATSARIKSSSTISPDLSFTVNTSNLSLLSETSMNITLDGTTKTITFSEGTYSSSEDVAIELTSLLNEAFGDGRIMVSGTDGNLTFSADSSVIKIDYADIEGSEALDVLGFTDADLKSNRLVLSSSISSYSSLFGTEETFSFTINGEGFTFDNTATLSKIISTINANESANVNISYSSISDKFTIASNETGTGSSVELSDTTGSFLSVILGGSGVTTAGTNAVVRLSLDGSTDEADQITITRNSNTFSIDGTTYTLKGMASGTAEEGVIVNIEHNTEAIFETITQFVSEYNDLIETINDKLTEERDSDFQPLTDSEKEDLSDDEIETWTEKARSGWLKNDSYLTNIVSALRSSLYAEVESLDGSGNSIEFILADIGITTSDYKENGKLTIDEDTLRTALANNTEGVLSLLTQKSSVGYSLYNSTENKETRYDESGLLWRINDLIKANISTVGKKGALVALVGNPNIGYIGTSTYSERIDKMQERIEELEDKLEDKQDYYWSKFTAMETAINTLNAQSSYLSAQFSS